MIRILKESETKREAIFAREDPVGSVEEPVREIIAQVRAKGDEALKRYTKEFDGVDITPVEVGQGAIDDGFRIGCGNVSCDDGKTVHISTSRM